MKYYVITRQIAYLLTIAALPTITGCFAPAGPEMAPVSGIVLQSGKPVPNAEVTFYPNMEGRPSCGSTDDAGRFHLVYTKSVDGALVGFHKVSISSGMPTPPADKGENGQESRPSIKRAVGLRVPKNVTWPDPVEVVAGENEITFDLKEVAK